MIISIVGLSGSGKSYIAKLLEQQNSKILHVDIDQIGHKSHKNSFVRQKLIQVFGLSIITNGEIDRKKLSSIVFNSKNAMAKLEEITWSYMEEEIDQIIANNKDKIILLDWLLLPKTKYFHQSDLRILITAPIEMRMQRVISRDNITKDKFLERELSAPHIDENQFEYIINNIDLQETKERVQKLYDKSIIHR